MSNSPVPKRADLQKDKSGTQSACSQNPVSCWITKRNCIVQRMSNIPVNSSDQGSKLCRQWRQYAGSRHSMCGYKQILQQQKNNFNLCLQKIPQILFFFPILIGHYSQETFCMKKYKHGFNATILRCQVLVMGLVLTQESHNNKSSFLCPFAFFWLQMRFPAA